MGRGGEGSVTIAPAMTVPAPLPASVALHHQRRRAQRVGLRKVRRLHGCVRGVLHVAVERRRALSRDSRICILLIACSVACVA
jgi:hypothetical protein